MTATLAGRVVLVTGAASGIGFGAATLFAARGATVVLADLEGGGRLEAAVARIGAAHAVGIPADLSAKAGVAALAEAMAARGLAPSYVVSNAGAPFVTQPLDPKRYAELDEAFWDRHLALNLKASFWLAQAFGETVRRNGGALVITSSNAGFLGGGSSIPYSVAKGGLITLTRELARALGPEARVNAIAPGLVDSPWLCRWSDEAVSAAIAATALKRVGTPEDYARLIYFLAVDATYITGQTIVADGGAA